MRNFNHMLEKSGPLVGIAIVTYNGRCWIGPCVKSIQKSSYSNIVLVVVDNASTDDTGLILEKEFPAVEVIQFFRNRGYATACNRGIEAVISMGAEFAFILNQDIVLEEKCIEEMVMAAKERGNLGIFSPLHLSYDGQNVDPIFAKNVIGKSTEVINDLWKGRLARTYRVEEISGASMMMHRDVVEAIGMMDELFFMYGEDGDYCRKARCAGINLYMVPLAVVRHWHTIAHPANGPSPADLFFERSELVYLLKDPNQTFVKRVMRVTWCSSRTFWNNFRHGRIRGAVKSIWTYLSVIMLLPDIEKSWRLDCRMIQKAIRRSQE